MSDTVAVVKGTDKMAAFQEVIELSDFTAVLMRAFENTGKRKNDFKIVIKPNMMVFVNPGAYKALVTDKDLVEYLVDHLIELGFSNIIVCEAQNDVGRMLKNHKVAFVAEKIGYKPNGRYKIVDLSLESIPYKYIYKTKEKNLKKWKDRVGESWLTADFRITFPKCKTHEHDWMTLGIKNVYGCFPPANKVCRYHIKKEIFSTTAASHGSIPVHFSFVDAWIASDGFQGYKIENPQELKMFFAGSSVVAVDMEVFKRAGLDPAKSKFIKETTAQLYDGEYPQYIIKGDKDTLFSQLCQWRNIEDKIVSGIDILEEVYIAWGFINLKPTAVLVDYKTFPPKNIFVRFMVWLSKKLYGIFKLFPWYRRLYERD